MKAEETEDKRINLPKVTDKKQPRADSKSGGQNLVSFLCPAIVLFKEKLNLNR